MINSDKEQEKLSEALCFKNSFEFKVLVPLPLLADWLICSHQSSKRDQLTSKLSSAYNLAHLYYIFINKIDSTVGNNRSSKNIASFFQITSNLEI